MLPSRSDDKRLILSCWSSESSQSLDLPMFGWSGWLLMLFLDPLRLVILISQWSGHFALPCNVFPDPYLIVDFFSSFISIPVIIYIKVWWSYIVAYEILRHDHIEPCKWEYISFMDYKHYETWHRTFKI